MDKLADVTFDDFALWYLERERREKGRRLPPRTARGRLWRMRLFHAGKLRPWFADRARWSVQQFTSPTELQRLLLTDIRWLRYTGIVVDDRSRLLGNAAARSYSRLYARDTVAERSRLNRVADQLVRWKLDFFCERYSRVGLVRNLSYFDRHCAGTDAFGIDDSVVVRTLERSEHEMIRRVGEPHCRFCLQDGHGRLLSYMAAVHLGLAAFRPVTAWVAEELATDASRDDRLPAVPRPHFLDYSHVSSPRAA